MYKKIVILSMIAGTFLSSTIIAGANTMAGPMIYPAAPSLPHETSFNVSINKTELVRLPQAASAIVVGNPQIADVSIHSNNTIFIVGRGFGSTNVIILDADGQTVMNADVRVTGSNSGNNVRIYNGSNSLRTTYSCAPYCQPSPELGDEKQFITTNTSKAPNIVNTFANGSSHPATPSISVTQTEGFEDDIYE